MVYKLKPLSKDNSYAVDVLYRTAMFKWEDDAIYAGNTRVMLDSFFYFSGLRDNIPGTITFCHCKPRETIEDAIKRLDGVQQSVILLPWNFQDHVTISNDKLFVFTKADPMVVFGRMMANSVVEVYPEFKRPQDFPRSCYIGPNVHVADDVEIGENVRLIGNIYIYSGVKIGNNVIVKPNTVIGGEGFEKDYDVEFDCTRHWPHMGKVIIEDNVQIGSNVCIDRGMFKDTIIRRGAQLDNLIHVSHSVEIKENVRIVASTMIAGSTTIGARSWIATSIIKNGLTLGDDCFIGLGSVVVNNIPEGKLAYGVPAKVKEDSNINGD